MKYFSNMTDTSNCLEKKHLMQRLSKAINVGNFTGSFFSTQIYRCTVLNKLTVRGNRPMKLQKIAAGAGAFSLPPF